MHNTFRHRLYRIDIVNVEKSSKGKNRWLTLVSAILLISSSLVVTGINLASADMVPSPPQNLQATGGLGDMVLAWQAPSSNGGSPIINYKIYRSSSSGTEGYLTTVGNVTSYIDTVLAWGHTYFYKVTAVNSIGTSSVSNEASARTLTIPSPPQNLQATAGIGNVTLSWQAPSSNGGSPITGYKIWRSSSSDTESLYTTIGNVTSYTDTRVTNDATYFYKVSAVNHIGYSPASNEAGASTFTPRNLVATAGNAQIALSWSVPLTNGGSAITNYKVYRGTSSNSELFLTQIGNSTSYTDTTVTPGQAYYYKVSAVNSIRESILSNEASASANAQTVSSLPQNLQATAGIGNVTLSWQAPSDNGGSPITNYNIYRSTSSGTETLYTTIGNVTSYTDTTVTNGQTYFYKVTAENSIGESSLSNEASAMPSAPAAAVITVKAVDTSGNVRHMYTLLKTSAGVTLATGITQVGFSVNTNTDYLIKIDNYRNHKFQYWQDQPSNTNLARPINISQDTTIVAVFS